MRQLSMCRWVTLAAICAAIWVPNIASAVGREECFTEFAKGGAVPETPECKDKAFSATQNLKFAMACHVPETVEAYCQPGPKPKLIGFFNGVWNTKDESIDSTKELKKLLGNKYKDHDLKYDTFYNNSAGIFDDVFEVFEQREAELESRWEVYWEFISGSADAPGSTSNILKTKLGKEAFVALFDLVHARILAAIARAFGNSPTTADVRGHLDQLKSHFSDPNTPVDGATLVAHSQGNLFVRLGYNSLLAEVPLAKAQVVHIAPASTKLDGDYVLADIDGVIQALVADGFVVPPTNIDLPLNVFKDFSGHKLIETYLDPKRAARERVKSMVNATLDKLVQP